LLLNAEDLSKYGVVDISQVGLSWSLSYSTELIVDGSVTEAYPSFIGTEIWYWDATQMSANGGTYENLGVTSVGKSQNGLLIQESGIWESVSISDLSLGQSSDEDDLTVPSGLENLSWRKLRDIELLVGVSNVSGSGDHLVVDNTEDGLKSENV